MWQFEHTCETKTSPEAIWRLYSNPGTWPLAFRMTEVTPERSFTDETEVPGATLRFIHRLSPLAGGGTRLTHRVEIDGPGADEIGAHLGPLVTADVPDTMESLTRHAASVTRHAMESPSPT